MLDHTCIFSKTGVVLWSKSWAKLKATVSGESPVSSLVRTVLLEDKGGASRNATIESYSLRWAFANEFDLVIVVVYQKVGQYRNTHTKFQIYPCLQTTDRHFFSPPYLVVRWLLGKASPMPLCRRVA